MNTKISAILVSVFVTTCWVSAGVIPGRWEKIDRLEPGSKILLTSKAEDRVRYTFRGSDSISLTVRARDGRELVIPKSHVAKIVQQNSRSSKPAWIGAAIGAGTGVAMGVGAASTVEETAFAKPEIAAVTFGLLGTLVGYTVGYLLTENPPDALLYEAATN
jgi:hypothetical protein